MLGYKMFRSAILVLTLFALSACVHSNGVPHRNGDFCPPGQAKKGNC